ncbi:MAG TPA: hypothetical protein VGN11_09970, partial [Candidatus Baltobacteraceae bacterium]|nr:hypothetical protein [Candidatus Baltobacteraceae bacterium]
MLLTAVTMFGQNVADPYRSLEDAHSARTSAWIDAQNARAEHALDAYSHNAAIAARVKSLALTGPQRYGAQLAGNTLFYFREVPPAPQPVLVAQGWPNGSARTALDPSTLGPAVSIDFIWPAPNGRLIAVGTSSGGSERTTIRLVDAQGHHRYSEALGPAGGGTTAPVVAWDADSRGFTYGRLPADGKQFGIKLYHHVIGTPQASDTLSLGDISPIAEYVMVTSSDAREAAALVQFGDGAPYRVYRRTSKGWHAVIGPDAGIRTGAFVGNKLYLVSTTGSLRGRIVLAHDDGTLQTVVPEEPDWALQSIAPIRGGLLVTKSWGTRWRVDHHDTSGKLI